MKPNHVKHWLLAAIITYFPILGLTGCGGGASDPTSVALKPNKEEPKGGGNGSVAGGTNGTGQGTETQPAAKAGFGAIKGRIVIAEADKGALPPPDLKIYGVGQAKVDPNYCAKDMPIPDQTLVVNRSNMGLKNTFFYLEKKPRGGKPKIESQSSWPTADESGEKLVLDQQNCTYVPHAMIVIAGESFLAHSQDPVVHSYKGSPPSSGFFNLTVPPAPPGGEGEPLEVKVFKKAEKSPVPISCATHNWMSAYQLPLDHPYAAVTDEDGGFTISDLPSGTHTFTIWHEKKGRTVRDYEVEVKADETVDLGDITLRLSQLN